MGKTLQLLAGAAVITVLFGTTYLVAQQSERMGADDSPERLATQISAQLASGGLDKLDTSDAVEIGSSEQPFFVVYDKDGAPIAGTGYLNGSLATLPNGVLKFAADNNGNRVSWQPEPALRLATVELVAGDRIVMAGQSLAPSESRTDRLGALTAAGWAAAMVVLAAAWLVPWLIRRRIPKSP
jgi:hypothetical protein